MEMWNNLCRACLAKEESFTHHICKDISPETYWFCTSIEVSEIEELPKTLCDRCHDLITRFAAFKQTCIESQDTLLNCYNKNIASENVDNKELQKEKSFQLDISNDKLMKEENLCEQYAEDLIEATFTDDETKRKDKQDKRKKRKKIKKLKVNQTKVKTSDSKCLVYSCNLCSKTFRNQIRFEAHKLQHDGNKMSYNCVPCDKSFVTYSGWQKHNESSHKVIALQGLACRHCGRVCTSRQSLQGHESRHGTKPASVCHVCGKRVASDSILKVHLETHKTDRERHHICSHCGKKFLTKTTLNYHISTLHSGKQFICEYCSYPFTHKYNLAKHLLKHEGKKLYKCDICLKSYASNASLVEHKRIHSGERPFLCSFCPKSFLSKRRLFDHHKIHTGERPHKCSVCEQRFTQRGTLQRHMKVHDKIPVVTQ